MNMSTTTHILGCYMTCVISQSADIACHHLVEICVNKFWKGNADS